MKRFSFSQIMCVCVTFISLMLSRTVMSNAQVPKSMNYQGYLTDVAGNPINDSVQMTFVLYDAATGVTALWQETQSVQCQQGYYNVILGQPGNPINLPGPKQYYLGVKVGMDAELTPRQPIMSVMSALFVDGLRFLGEDTTIVNKEAWYSNTTGFGNTYLGKGAGVSNTTGNKNVFVGAWAGDHNTDGLCNTFMGYGAGNQNTTGNGNTFLGHVAGNANQSGWGNTFVGHVTGNKNTGSMNTFIGAGAGDTNITGDGNILIGHQAGRYEMGSNRLYIANSETPTPLLYGEFDTQKLAVNGNLGIA